MTFTPFESFLILFYTYSSYFILSNLSVYLIVILLVIYLVLSISKYVSSVISINHFKIFVKRLYQSVYNLISEQLPSEGKRYIPFMEYLFLFIFACNVLGFFPYSVALTSQICLIFTVAFMAFLGMQYIGIELYNSKAFRFFLPPGIPTILSIFIVNVEIISYVFRVISLSVRILANIVAGHLLCKIIGIFAYSIYNDGESLLFAASIIPCVVIIALCFLELFVCFLQAYVFIILCCMYLRDVLTIYLH